MALGNSARAIAQSRHGIRNVLDKRDDQLNAIIGPCSIHDPPAALDYARWLVPGSWLSHEYPTEA